MHNVIGKIEKELKLGKGLFNRKLSWRWKRRHFAKLKLEPKNAMNRHIVIVGQTGSGKSNASKVIAKTLALQGYVLLVLDFHNEYLGLASELGIKVYSAESMGIDIMQQEGSAEEKASDVAMTLRRILRLGYRQYDELYKLALYTYEVCERTGKQPSMQQLLYSLTAFSKHAKGAEAGVLSALQTRLVLLASHANARSIDFQQLLNEGAVFALSGLHSSEAQAAFAESLIRRLYQHALKQRLSKEVYLVIEEAGKLEGSKMLDRLVAEGRKYGIGIIAIAQRAKAISSEIRSNAGLFVAFYQREPEELNYLANLLAAGNELERFIKVKQAMRNLQIGQAIVMKGRSLYIAKFDRASEGVNCDYLLMQACTKPSTRDELNKLHCNELDELIARKIASKELSEYTIPGSALAGTYYMQTSMLKNSAEHDITLYVMAKFLNSKGIPCKVLNGPNEPDIEVYQKGRKIAIEYETGKKSIEANKKMLEERERHYDEIIMVVNESAYSTYKEALASQKVKVITLEQFSVLNL